MRDESAGFAVATGAGDDTMQVLTIAGTPTPFAIAPFLVPGDQVWEAYSVFAKYVAGGTVANRFAGLTVDNGTTTVLTVQSSTAQVAATTVSYTFTQVSTQGGATTSGASATLPLPLFVLAPGWRLSLSMTGAQLNDVWSNVAALVRVRYHDEHVATRTDDERLARAIAEAEHAREAASF